MVSMFESKVLNPRRFRVSVRYPETGVAGIYATSPMKYSPHIEESLQAALISFQVAGSLSAVRPFAGSSRRIL
jgi:hypothetical protein